MENPALRGPVENTGKRAAALAEKFEGVRKRFAPERKLILAVCEDSRPLMIALWSGRESPQTT